MNFLLRLTLNAVIVLAVAHFIPNIIVRHFASALFFAFVLGIINSVIRPVLIALTMPISIVTFGLFIIIINAFTFWLASKMSFGVEILTFPDACLGGVIVSLGMLITKRK